jgi:hypothetical protein
VIEMIEHENFPRQPRLTPPSGSASPAWWALEMLRDRALGKPEARDLAGLRVGLAAQHPFWRPVRDVGARTHGSPLDASKLQVEAPRLAAFAPAQGMTMFRVERTLGSEVLSRRSAPVRTMAGPPAALLSIADHARLGANGRVTIEAAGHTVELAARALRTVPDGVVLVPRDVEWPSPVAQGAAARVASAAVEEVQR